MTGHPNGSGAGLPQVCSTLRACPEAVYEGFQAGLRALLRGGERADILAGLKHQPHAFPYVAADRGNLAVVAGEMFPGRPTRAGSPDTKNPAEALLPPGHVDQVRPCIDNFLVPFSSGCLQYIIPRSLF